MTSLRDWFEQYRADNQDESLRSSYKAACSQIVDIREGRQKLTSDFVKQAWTGKYFASIHVSHIRIKESEFDAIADLLMDITKSIIADPIPTRFGTTIEDLASIRNKGQISLVPHLVTQRLFAVVAPNIYTGLVVLKDVELYTWMREKYGLNIHTSGNRAEKDSSTRSSFVAHGLPDTDHYLLNTFIWSLANKVPSLSTNEQLFSQNEEEADEQEIQKNIPFPPALNTIYYGPPGTGKTFTVREILNTHFTTHVESITEEEWEESLVKEIVWREVIVAALSDLGGRATVPQIRKHRLVEAKFRCMDGKKTSRARIWSSLQTHSPQDSITVNYSAKREPVLFDKDNDGNSTWMLLSEWNEDAPDAIQLLERFRQGKPAKDGHKKIHYTSITFHQSYSYEEFVEGIRPVLADSNEEDVDNLSYRLHNGIFKKICIAARDDPEQQYALLIDEINRGNISKIFGELITLIEDTKREGNPEEMSVMLPYSGESFSIPSNLRIIGTMNTADRSLALMDTALRRRFTFVRVDPDYSILAGKEVDGVRLDRLLEAINKRIEVLYDKEHVIGHSYILHVNDIESLRLSFKNRIIPLLEEYFFEDWEKIHMVLGDDIKKEKGLNEYCFLFKEDQSHRLFGSNTSSIKISPRWQYNDGAMLNPIAYTAIYDPDAVERD